MLSFEARESVGYGATWTIGHAGAPVDISGWTFEAMFEREAGAADFWLGSVADREEQGFYIHDGPGGQLAVLILPATLQAIDDTTGSFQLYSDLLGTPPGSPRQFLTTICATITEGPTP